MNAPPRSGWAVGVLCRGHRAAILLLLLALPAAALPPGRAALAQDGGKGGGKAPAPPEDPEEKKTFEAMGAEWKAGDAGALAARFPEKRKVSLRLPGMDAGDYRAEQAKSLLEDYFAKRTFTKVEVKSVKDSTGTYEAEYTRDDRKKVKAELLLVLGTEGRKRVLVSARESP